jgi:hypothetical protein
VRKGRKRKRREEGRGKREEGRGKREEGRQKRERKWKEGGRKKRKRKSHQQPERFAARWGDQRALLSPRYPKARV